MNADGSPASARVCEDQLPAAWRSSRPASTAGATRRRAGRPGAAPSSCCRRPTAGRSSLGMRTKPSGGCRSTRRNSSVMAARSSYGRHPQHLELAPQVADADPEDEPARLELGPGPRHGRHLERVPVGGHQHVDAETDAPGAAQAPPAGGQGLEEGRLSRYSLPYSGRRCDRATRSSRSRGPRPPRSGSDLRPVRSTGRRPGWRSRTSPRRPAAHGQSPAMRRPGCRLGQQIVHHRSELVGVPAPLHLDGRTGVPPSTTAIRPPQASMT